MHGFHGSSTGLPCGAYEARSQHGSMSAILLSRVVAKRSRRPCHVSRTVSLRDNATHVPPAVRTRVRGEPDSGTPGVAHPRTEWSISQTAKKRVADGLTKDPEKAKRMFGSPVSCAAGSPSKEKKGVELHSYALLHPPRVPRFSAPPHAQPHKLWRPSACSRRKWTSYEASERQRCCGSPSNQ